MRSTSSKDYALLLLRLAGFYLAVGHGWGKIAALATGDGAGVIRTVEGVGFPLPVLFAWALALTEFAGGLLVFVGFATRYAAAFAAFVMFVASFLRHGALTQFLAWVGVSSATPEQLGSLGNAERAVLYLIVFGAVLILGGGQLSLDARLAQRRR